jgi:hypothetical protein
MKKKKRSYVTLPVEFNQADVPKSILAQRPQLRFDGNLFYCYSGIDHDDGISGSGNTPKQAMKEWSKNRKRAKVRAIKKLKR